MDFHLGKIKIQTWILLAIIVLGIFLRTYNLREWLYFYPDQARDAVIVEKVVNEGKSWPLMGAIAASTKFKIGPMYYYFQIITAKIFGTGPARMVYPDLFFTILSIPLLFYFLSLYFSRNLSLALAGLYSISFFAIEYSRFAWNPNPIPFFTLVFLIATWKFLMDGNKTSWVWIILIGIAVGIGIQLHTFLLLLFPAVLFFIFVYFAKNRQWAISRWAAVILLVIALNVPQIISEMQNNYANSKLFLKLFNSSSENGKLKFLENLKLDILDHSQANAHILTSLGDKLDFTYNSTLKPIFKADRTGKGANYPVVAGIGLSLAFFLFGCFMLARYFRQEEDKEKKYFLGLIALFSALSFLIMLPIMDSLAIRYFIHMFFLPFFFLGLLLKFISEKYQPAYLPAAVMLLGIFAVTNFYTISSEAEEHYRKERSNEKYVVLGEIEMMRDYILDGYAKKTVYLFCEKKYIQNYIKPMTYVFSEKGVMLIRTKKLERVPKGDTVFLLGNSTNRQPNYLEKYDNIASFRNFGQVGIFKMPIE